MIPAFAHFLPYWTISTIETQSGSFAFLVMVDGTFVVGFEATGTDLFASDNARLNAQAAALRRAANGLPPDAFLQVDWHTGLDFEDVVDGYARRGEGAHPILREQRRQRAAFLRERGALSRGRLMIYVGVLRALGPLAAHVGRPPPWTRAIDFLRGAPRKDPALVGRSDIHAAASAVAEVATRVKDELAGAGVRLRRCNAGMLVSEIHAALNPVSSRSIAPPPVGAHTSGTAGGPLASPVVHAGLTLREQLPLGDLQWAKDHFTLDDPPLLHRALSLQRLPAFTRPDFAMGLQFASSSVRLVTTILGTDRQELTEKLTRKRNRMQAQAAGIVRDVAADVALGEYEQVLETMLTNDQRVLRASVTAIVSGVDERALDQATRDLKEAFAEVGAVATTETGRQLYSFLGALPGNGASSPQQHTVLTNTAADLLPTFSPSEGDATPSLLYHTRQRTLRKVSFSSDKPNKNVLVLGGSGSGKSFHVASVFEQACLAEGGPVLVVDVQGPEVSSYRVLCDALGGSYTALSGTDDIAFNPFFSHEEILAPATGVPGERRGIDEEKLSYLKQLVAFMAMPSVAGHPKRALILDVARTAILRAYGATKTKGRPPLLRDVVAELETYQAKEREYEDLAREMFLQLRTWTKDPHRARLLDRPSTYRSQAQLQVFDFYGLEKDKELATVLLLSVSFFIWSTIQRAPRDVTKFVLFDETWKLLTHETAAEIVGELYRTGRKWGASTWAITQNLSDFTSSPVHGALLGNAATIFLNQHTSDHDSVATLCDLNARELELFKSLRMKSGSYSELLLVDRAQKEAAVLQVRPTPFDLWLNTTRPEDVALRARVMRERGLSMLEAIRFCADMHPTGAPARDAMRGAA